MAFLVKPSASLLSYLINNSVLQLWEIGLNFLVYPVVSHMHFYVLSIFIYFIHLRERFTCVFLLLLFFRNKSLCLLYMLILYYSVYAAVGRCRQIGFWTERNKTLKNRSRECLFSLSHVLRVVVKTRGPLLSIRPI